MDLPDYTSLDIKLKYKSEIYTETILNKPTIDRIKSQLDTRYQYATEWNLLFSIYEHGRSYSKLLESFTDTILPYILVFMTEEDKLYIIYFEDKLHLSIQPFGSRKVLIFNEENALSEKTIICTDKYFAFGYTEKGYLKIQILSNLHNGKEFLFGDSVSEFQIKYLELWNITE